MKSLDIREQNIVVIGGCGHVGLPLGVTFALAGAKTFLVDIDQRAVDTVNSGHFPFLEKGGDAELRAALEMGLVATTDPRACRDANVLIFVTGTPVDEHLNPKLSDVIRIFDNYREYFSAGVAIIMRSTLFPGTMEHLKHRLDAMGVAVRLAFCPERVSQGFALEEIKTLPQIVSAFDEESFQIASSLFAAIAPSIIRLNPLEAEITKLMANAWRYLEFAIANQFYMIAESKGVDFYRVYDAIRHDYPRASGYKAPGFAAGPCLFKDTMQLASYFDNQFYLGHSAMLVNEGLATFVVDRMSKMLGGNLWGKTVGLLGMAFKSNNDDIRESLSYRVKKGLEFEGATVLLNDPFIADSKPLDELLQEAHGLILCTPHREYQDLKISKPIVDVWGYYRDRTLEISSGNL
ncbi:MAG: nucleotide sugar dehydrogenase [Deltaproteobacteria bacterium]|nr:nucleotide sugar dehydrogenase [Deltaproteobacteria bacterium]